jgi:hypothetical protein
MKNDPSQKKSRYPAEHIVQKDPALSTSVRTRKPRVSQKSLQNSCCYHEVNKATSSIVLRRVQMF